MDPNSNTEHGAGNAEAYPESEDWEFPLSASLADIENITSGQVNQWHFVKLQCGRVYLTGCVVLLPLNALVPACHRFWPCNAI